MSGGVDSSTAAALLKREGHDVIGVGLKFPSADGCTSGASRSCCGIAGMDDAQRVADHIGIPFYMLDYGRVFEEEVIAGFCKSYLSGRTPNPCVECNRTVKFGRLLKFAETLGADFLATGHYAQTRRAPCVNRTLLRKAADASRDQTYFLHSLSQKQLGKALFPLGGMTKDQVRSIAASFGLHVSAKPGSQNICFIPGRDYRRVLADRFAEVIRPGPIMSMGGNGVGS